MKIVRHHFYMRRGEYKGRKETFLQLKDVLENPDNISQTVLNKGPDAGTAFEILSIDISDVDVGRNIAAQLQIDQAEAEAEVPLALAHAFREDKLGVKAQSNK